MSYCAFKHDIMEGFSAWWNAGTFVYMFALNPKYGPFLNDLGLATCGSCGLKFALNI